jgi:hypothetical protein
MVQRVKACARRRDRFPVDIDALVYRGDGTQAQVRVTDFSDQGCRIQGISDFHIGERLQIAIPRMGHIKAQVRWIAAGITGARFVTESDF